MSSVEFNKIFVSLYVFQRNTSRHNSKPLKVEVMRKELVAHQQFALKVLGWLQTVSDKAGKSFKKQCCSKRFTIALSVYHMLRISFGKKILKFHGALFFYVSSFSSLPSSPTILLLHVPLILLPLWL